MQCCNHIVAVTAHFGCHHANAAEPDDEFQWHHARKNHFHASCQKIGRCIGVAWWTCNRGVYLVFWLAWITARIATIHLASPSNNLFVFNRCQVLGFHRKTIMHRKSAKDVFARSNAIVFTKPPPTNFQFSRSTVSRFNEFANIIYSPISTVLAIGELGSSDLR